MSFVAKLDHARAVLERQKRLSVRALGRELELAGDDLDEIVEELVDIQQVAKLDGKALVWTGQASTSPAPAPAASGARNYTPKHLADKILAHRSAMEGEKKQVTVLFCDVAGSMDLAEALGPEAWHQTLNAFFEVLTSAVHDYEGTVNQYTGDGIMALFGAPIAAEEHARRACMAALAIQQQLADLQHKVHEQFGKQFASRIGINSGVVVVGRIGDDLRMDYTAQGQVVGIAARLEALAELDSIVISRYTEKLVEGFFELAPLGQQRIKGVSDPLECYRLDQARDDVSRLDIARERGFSKFVGRDVEMAILKQAYRRANAGQGQSIHIVAPAGSGKSRLCWEFEQWCRAQGAKVATSISRPDMRNVPHYSTRQITACYYGFQSGDSPEVMRRKIRERNLAWNPKAEKDLALAYEFQGVPDPELPPPPMPPEQKDAWRKRATAWALKHHAKSGTVVYIAEDMHWGDRASVEGWSSQLEAVGHLSALTISNARPEFQPPWNEAAPNYQRLTLQPLEADAAEAMLLATLGNDPSLGGLAERIMETSGGNPFFIEEIVRGLIEQGDLSREPGQYQLQNDVKTLPLPDSVHSLLAARIDRLDNNTKQLLQSAAVIGRTFNTELLRDLTGFDAAQISDSLMRLQDAEFVYPNGEHSYIFKHALTQDVAYGSLLQGKREVLHRKVAEWLEAHADPSGNNLAQLSGHWEQAGNLHKAALFMHQAAKAALQRDLQESLRLRREFLRLEQAQPAQAELARLGISARRTLLEWSGIAPLTSAEADRLYTEACALAEKHHDPIGLATITGSYAIRLNGEGRMQEASAMADRLIAMVEKSGHAAGTATALGGVGGIVYGMNGEIAKCLRVTAKALEIFRERPEIISNAGLNMYSCSTNWHAIPLAMSGKVSEGLALLDGLVAKGDYENDIMIQCADGNAFAIETLAGIRENAAARNARIEPRKVAGIGPWWELSSYTYTAEGHWLQENWAAAERDLEKALSIAEGNEGLQSLRIWTGSLLPWVRLRLGKSAEALTLLKRNLDESRAMGSWWILGIALWNACRIWREVRKQAAIADIEAALIEWQHTIEESDLELFRHLWWWETARLADLKGDAAGYRAGLAKALASAEECGASGHAEQLRQELGRISA